MSSIKYHPSRFSIAPMLRKTNRHCRFFLRKFSKKSLLYTEMITPNAILYGKKDYLAYSEEEHPISLQLGGSDHKKLKICAKLAQERGYDEINLNIGCPSYRAQHGMFGVCLMKNARLVSDCITAVKDVIDIPVTIKTRIGINDQDHYEFLHNFIEVISQRSECESFIIHARKAILSNLNSKQNREIPQLNYQYVYQLKRDFPHLKILINGGIQSLEEAKEHLQYTDGVMIGRAVYQDPTMLTGVDQEIFGVNTDINDPVSIVYSMYSYIEKELSSGTLLGQITCHMLNLFRNIRGARQYRRYLSEHAYKIGADIKVLDNALNLILKV